MKKTTAITFLSFGLIALVLLSNCADPLDITNQPVPHPQPADTLFVVDTVFVIDTVTQTHFDTTYIIDTVFHGGIDTVMIIDTVIVTKPDTISIVDTIYQTDTLTVVDTVIVTTDTSRMMCGRIESCQKEIVWLLQNASCEYRLSFAAYIEKDQPPQSLTVQIDDSVFSWNTADSESMAVDMWLNDNAAITIISQKPPARGHAVYICLSLSRR